MSDLKTAFRAMRGHPGFSTIVILTMAVGIAVNAEIFSVCDRLVLHPVTIPDPSSLVAIWFNNPQRNVQTPSSSVPRYEELRAEVRAFSSIGEVVGVMPPRLSVPFGQVQVLAPRVFGTGGLTPAQIEAGATFAQPIARLKAGVSLDQARAELAAFSSGYKGRHPTNIDANNISEPRFFVATLVSGVKPTMYALLGAVGCVLLIACANAASLLLSRLLRRRKEIAVRLSLGATRLTIIRQLMTESLLFSAAGGALGMLLATWSLALLQSVLASQLPPNTALTLNWRALVFTGGLTALCALLIGLFPALQTPRTDVVEQLKDGARGTSGGSGGRSRQTLIVAEVMLSVVLLVCAGLLLASFLGSAH